MSDAELLKQLYDTLGTYITANASQAEWMYGAAKWRESIKFQLSAITPPEPSAERIKDLQAELDLLLNIIADGAKLSVVSSAEPSVAEDDPPPRPVPPTTDRILEGETRPRKMQPIINCDCGFTIDCRNDRGKEVECPQCGNQYTRKAALTGDE